MENILVSFDWNKTGIENAPDYRIPANRTNAFLENYGLSTADLMPETGVTLHLPYYQVWLKSDVARRLEEEYPEVFTMSGRRFIQPHVAEAASNNPQLG